MKKLKHILLFNNLNKSYQVLIYLVAAIFVYYNFSLLLLFLFILFNYLYFKKSTKVLFISFIIFLIIIIRISLNNYFYNNKINKHIENNNLINDIYKVNNVAYKNNYQLITIKENSYYYQIYLYDEDIKKNIIPGSIIYLKGYLEITKDVNLENTFSYYDYLKSNNIIGKINVNEIKHLKNRFSLNLLSYYIKNYYDKHYNSTSSSYLKALILGDKSSMDLNLKDNINKIGISHLFVVSGLHVSIFVLIISYFSSLLKLNEKTTNIITVIILFIYLFITNILISVFRVFLSQILKFLNKDKQISTFNLFSINIIISMILFSNKINTYSFILTYLISGMIILSKNILKNKASFTQSLIISIISTFSTLPIIININGEINILSIIYNLFYIPLVTYLILPLSLITTLLPFIKYIYSPIINIFNNLINITSKISTGIIIFPKFNIVYLLIYYISFFIILNNIEQKKKKKTLINIFILLISLIIYQNKLIFNLNTEIRFLNLEIGEATLIKYPSNTCNILIDTGEKEEILLYLKKEGIKRIDYLIISHGDSDHNGMLKEIINSLNVKNVLISLYDNNSIRYLNKINKQINLIKLIAPNIIKTKDFKIELYNPTKYNSDINDNSLAFTLSIKNLKILFTGDISKAIEKEIINKYKIDVDILKVAHHGSNTSSSKEFLNSIEFKVAIAMNGYNNKYGFPNKYVIERFKDKILLNTINNQTIIFKKEFYRKEYKYKNYLI